MFERSSLSSVMANSSAEEQRRVTYVTVSHEDEGFPKAIKDFIPHGWSLPRPGCPTSRLRVLASPIVDRPCSLEPERSRMRGPGAIV
jgi:hypothetical protein